MSGQPRGLLQVYTGDGKGKTTAALGLAMRAVGHGLRACFIQFMKGDLDLGERKAAARLSPELQVHWFSAPTWGDPDGAPAGTPWWRLPPSDADREQARKGIEFAATALTSGAYDLVVLDEIFEVLRHGLASLDDLLRLTRIRSPGVELVMTGREAPEEIIAVADLVTEMRAVKHPYDRGVGARRGIEY